MKIFIFLLLGAALLIGCRSTEQSQQSPQTAPAPMPMPGSQSELGGSGNEVQSDSDFPGCPELTSAQLAVQLVRQINKVRQAGCDCLGTQMEAVGNLKWDEKLMTEASTHVFVMLEIQRITPSTENENVSHGQRLPEKLIQAWQLNETHCKNMMNPEFTHIGAATKDCYWDVIFAKR
jgi:uncharacterized protein YkwD